MTDESIDKPAGRPMDGTGTLLRRGRDGQPTEDYFGGANVHGGYWVQLVDAWPHGRLQAQLDRIEAKLDGTPIEGVLITSEVNRWAAFTDDELATALTEIGETPDWRRGGSGFREEIAAELARRREAG